MDETTQHDSEGARELVHKVPVRFGDVFRWWGQGHTGQEWVVIEVPGNDLSGAPIVNDPEKGEMLGGAGSITGPIEVVSHWDFDRVLEGWIKRYPLKQQQEVRPETEEVMRRREAVGEVIYEFADEETSDED